MAVQWHADKGCYRHTKAMSLGLNIVVLCVCFRSTARACQLTRGLLPMLATPGPNGDAVLESAIVAAAAAGLVAPRHHVVVLQQIHEDFCVKVAGAGLDWSGGVGGRGLPAYVVALFKCYGSTEECT